MANRIPLVVSDNKIKELPVGDSLNLSGNSIVNATSATTVDFSAAGVTDDLSNLRDGSAIHADLRAIKNKDSDIIAANRCGITSCLFTPQNKNLLEIFKNRLPFLMG